MRLCRYSDKNPAAWGYLAQTVNLSAGLILLPILGRSLSAEEIGLWFVFNSVIGLAHLVDFGFQPTIVRNAAFVFSGASSFKKTGLPTAVVSHQKQSQQLLAELIASCRLIYRWVAGVSAVVLFGAGTAYISALVPEGMSSLNINIAWVLCALGGVVTISSNYMYALLHGINRYVVVSKNTVLSRGVMLIVAGIGLFTGCGLVGLGVAVALSGICARWAGNRALHQHRITRDAFHLSLAVDGRELSVTLWYNACRLGLVQFSTFLVQRCSVFIASSFVGLKAAAGYGVATTIILVLASFASVVAQLRMPRIVGLIVEGDTDSLKSVYLETLFLGLGSYFVGLIVLLATVVFGAGYFNVPLIPVWQLALLGVIYALEINHTIAANVIAASNSIPFVVPSVVSGLATVCLGFILVQEFEIFGLIIAQGLVQIAYNNWKWPLVVSRIYGLRWEDVFRFVAGRGKLYG